MLRVIKRYVDVCVYEWVSIIMHMHAFLDKVLQNLVTRMALTLMALTKVSALLKHF